MNTLKKILINVDSFSSEFGLVYDNSEIRRACEKVKNALPLFNLQFSVKSFPNREYLKVLAPFLDGFDFSNDNELALVSSVVNSSHSLWLTNSSYKTLTKALELPNDVYYTLDVFSDLGREYPNRVRLGLRIDPLSLLDRGHSRYGFLKSVLKELPESIRKKIYYFHTHMPGNLSSSDVFNLRSKMEDFMNDFPSLRLINLGGGLAESNIDAFQMVSENFPKIKLAIEPGRWFSESAGHAFTKIKYIFKKGEDLYIVGDLSFEAHLKWSRGISHSLINLGQSNLYQCKRLIYSSSNALESDMAILRDNIQEMFVSVGDYLFLNNVPGYSAVWNQEFNGVDKAKIIFLE